MSLLLQLYILTWTQAENTQTAPWLQHGARQNLTHKLDHHHKIPQYVTLIRHGEKNQTSNHLSPRGFQRANCIGKNLAHYNFTHIFAYNDKPSHRSVETVTPLAHALNLHLDTSFKRDDIQKLVDYINSLDKNAHALVCWEHHLLTDIAHDLGVDNPPEFADDEYDAMWDVRNGILYFGREHC